MADFAKRPEVTVTTMGKVHNPSGEGIPIKKIKPVSVSISSALPPTTVASSSVNPTKPLEDHETKVVESGSARRNIIRKKSDNGINQKKHGGSGKGKWKHAMDGSDQAPIPISKDDPLYDELESDPYVLSSTPASLEESSKTAYDTSTTKPIYGPLLTLPEFKIRIRQSLQEYFDSGNPQEFVLSVQELKCRAYHPEIIKKAISLACDQGPRERELTSKLLTQLHPDLLTSAEEVARGFEILLLSLKEFSIDIPDAITLFGSFLARAVVDEVLPPAFLSQLAMVRLSIEEEEEGNFPPPETEIGVEKVIAQAVRLLSREHCTARLEKIWGPGDGRPVPELKVILDHLLKEYLLSRELDEAALCVRELEALHFHHELVKRGLVIAMEQEAGQNSSKGSLDAMAALFGFLMENAILSEEQFRKGLQRFRDVLPDVSLDVPDAKEMLNEFQGMMKKLGCLTEETI